MNIHGLLVARVRLFDSRNSPSARQIQREMAMNKTMATIVLVVLVLGTLMAAVVLVIGTAA
jgi:hypothetical protein